MQKPDGRRPPGSKRFTVQRVSPRNIPESHRPMLAPKWGRDRADMRIYADFWQSRSGFPTWPQQLTSARQLSLYRTTTEILT